MKAIIIVDLQRAFPIPASLSRRIAERARQFPLRIFTQFVNPPGSLFRRVLNRQMCSPASEEKDLLLAPQPRDLVIRKETYGFTTEQIADIKARGVKEVLVCGVDTDACVLAVVFSLFDHGIKCEVDPSLTWSSGGLKDQALAIIREQFDTGWPLAEERPAEDAGEEGEEVAGREARS